MTFCIVNVLQRSSQLHRCGCILISRRTLTSNEVATALRPFYFNVHPDLFGQFPNERVLVGEMYIISHSYISGDQKIWWP
ncbi:hypothetical protein M8J77_007712 [Diaphorina citri]|nr:hypothetical protein M8J77_007712 [Diaphorina citri]